MNELLSTISLCKRAGKLTLGFDVVKQSIIDKKAFLVMLTSDISAKTQKEVTFICEKNAVQLLNLPVTLDDINKSVSKRAGVLSVTDQGLANKLITVANRQNREVM